MLITNRLCSDPRTSPKDVQILVVDNDQDSRNLYADLLESSVTEVTALSSIKDALDFLDYCIPAIVICEMRFLGECVYPLIQQIRYLVLNSGRTIPILVTSAFAPTGLEPLPVVEAYVPKPIDSDSFIDKVWEMILLSSINCLLDIQGRVTKRNIGKTLCCSAGVS